MNFLSLNASELDQHIYRIIPQEFAFSLFANRQNVLSQVHNWKDKFENFQLSLGGLLDGERFAFSFENDIVGQCWTRHSHSEAMWGIYANDPTRRFIRIRSTPRKLLDALVKAHPEAPQDTCFVGKIEYKSERALKRYVETQGVLRLSPSSIAQSLLLKRLAFRHESEIRLIYIGDRSHYDAKGLYRYDVDAHEMITQLMADPNRDRQNWKSDKARILKATGFAQDVKRSKIYDPPEWNTPLYKSGP